MQQSDGMLSRCKAGASVLLCAHLGAVSNARGERFHQQVKGFYKRAEKRLLTLLPPEDRTMLVRTAIATGAALFWFQPVEQAQQSHAGAHAHLLQGKGE